MPTDCGEETHLPLRVQNECSSVHSTGSQHVDHLVLIKEIPSTASLSLPLRVPQSTCARTHTAAQCFTVTGKASALPCKVFDKHTFFYLLMIDLSAKTKTTLIL